MLVNKVHTCCIIDDDPIFVYGTKRIMKEMDFYKDLIVYNNGYEALEGIKKISSLGQKFPEVIFLDINMPVMTGWELLDELLKLPTNNFEKTSIYIISSSVDPRDMEKVKNYKSVNNYIIKPITLQDLTNVLESLSN